MLGYVFVAASQQNQCSEFGELFYESNTLHITSYFYEKVSNSIILLLLSKVSII